MESINKASEKTRKIQEKIEKAEAVKSAATDKVNDAFKTVAALKEEKTEQVTEKIVETKAKIKNKDSQLAMKLFTGFNLIVCIVLAIVGYRMGIFTSVETLQSWVAGFGIAAPLIFMIFQAIQVIIPIIPGGVSLLGGVLIFGPWWGFVYNYVGICAGSLIVFGISRTFGKPLMYKLFPAKAVEKYESWTGNKNRFAKLFALAIFFPCAPDDMLCYLAGTTSMKWKTYTLIILLGKPASTALYSIGLTTVFNGISSLLG